MKSNVERATIHPDRDGNRRFTCPECGIFLPVNEITECDECGAHLELLVRTAVAPTGDNSDD